MTAMPGVGMVSLSQRGQKERGGVETRSCGILDIAMQNGELFLPGAVVDAGNLEITLQHHQTGEAIRLPLLSCLTWEENGRFFIHCLELDVLADEVNEQKAIHCLGELVVEQMRSAVEEHTELFHPAPQPYWDKYRQIRNNRLVQTFLETTPPTFASDIQVRDAALTHA